MAHHRSEDKLKFKPTLLLFLVGAAATSLHAGATVNPALNLEGDIIEGTANFIADRFKQELAQTYFASLKKKISKAPLDAFFPDTLAFLNAKGNFETMDLGLAPGQVTFAQVYSPGVFVVWGGLFDTPLALGLGYQVRPALLSVSSGGVSRADQ